MPANDARPPEDTPLEETMAYRQGTLVLDMDTSTGERVLVLTVQEGALQWPFGRLSEWYDDGLRRLRVWDELRPGETLEIPVFIIPDEDAPGGLSRTVRLYLRPGTPPFFWQEYTFDGEPIGPLFYNTSQMRLAIDPRLDLADARVEPARNRRPRQHINIADIAEEEEDDGAWVPYPASNR